MDYDEDYDYDDDDDDDDDDEEEAFEEHYDNDMYMPKPRLIRLLNAVRLMFADLKHSIRYRFDKGYRKSYDTFPF